MRELILASSSPRRREILSQAGYQFKVEPARIQEDPKPGEDAIRLASRLAREKAQTVFAAHASIPGLMPPLVLGADTVVCCSGILLGKPRDAEDAKRMLRLLSGQTHKVVTGVALVQGSNRVEVAAELTLVTMRVLQGREIDRYVATGEPMDKAGGYAIQGLASRWIPRINGCYFNVVGLPIALVAAMLEAVDTDAPAEAF